MCVCVCVCKYQTTSICNPLLRSIGGVGQGAVSHTHTHTHTHEHARLHTEIEVDEVQEKWLLTIVQKDGV